MKIAVITCYFQPDYVRARTLRTALEAAPDTEVLIIKNRHKGLLRFIEVPLRIMAVRWRHKPDAYVITFRGYEMLVFMVMTLARKPIVFDEMVNFTEWMEEHRRIRRDSAPYRLFRRWYGRLAGHSRFVLADTEAHAHYSAKLNRLDMKRYRTIPVGTDETVFYKRPEAAKKASDAKFTVFYYGFMRPLHGLEYVLEAANLLKDRSEIRFRFIGGGDKTARACRAAAADGAHIAYESWLPFEDLPEAALEASLTLGGPFGGTLQSQFVVTGKTYQFLALGAPVLVGRNQVNETFKDKVNSLVVPQADPKAIADAIIWAQGHPKELKKLAGKGRRTYEEKFSQQVINGLVARLVKDLGSPAG